MEHIQRQHPRMVLEVWNLKARDDLHHEKTILTDITGNLATTDTSSRLSRYGGAGVGSKTTFEEAQVRVPLGVESTPSSMVGDVCGGFCNSDLRGSSFLAPHAPWRVRSRQMMLDFTSGECSPIRGYTTIPMGTDTWGLSHDNHPRQDSMPLST